MSKTLAATGEHIEINPALLIIDQKANGRSQEYDTDSIYAMANDLLQNGQLQEIGVEPADEEGKYTVVFGVRRSLGGLYLNENDERFEKTPFLMKAVVREKGTSKTNLITNITENWARKELTPIDIADNIKRLRAFKGDDKMTEDEIYAVFGKDTKNTDHQAWFKRHEALSALPAAVRKQVQSKLLSTNAALLFVGIADKEAEKIAKTLEANKTAETAGNKRASKKIEAKEVATALEGAKAEAAKSGKTIEKETTTPAPKAKVAKNRSLPEVLKFFKDMADEKNNKSADGRKLSAALHKWITNPGEPEQGLVGLLQKVAFPPKAAK